MYRPYWCCCGPPRRCCCSPPVSKITCDRRFHVLPTISSSSFSNASRSLGPSVSFLALCAIIRYVNMATAATIWCGKSSGRWSADSRDRPINLCTRCSTVTLGIPAVRPTASLNPQPSPCSSLSATSRRGMCVTWVSVVRWGGMSERSNTTAGGAQMAFSIFSVAAAAAAGFSATGGAGGCGRFSRPPICCCCCPAPLPPSILPLLCCCWAVAVAFCCCCWLSLMSSMMAGSQCAKMAKNPISPSMSPPTSTRVASVFFLDSLATDRRDNDRGP
mmetsp:Transcript_17189/g.41299  ORF Transcript_17189/g.41299 Transcript_17189/m.41299 type:complete len:274 (-) Transcript_17189:1678-2499(-)